VSDLNWREVEWEFRVSGDEYSAWADDEMVASVRDARILSGYCMIEVRPGIQITRLETVGLTPTQPGGVLTKPGPPKLPTVQAWQDVTESVRAKARTIPGISVEAEAIKHAGNGGPEVISLAREGLRDGAIRITHAGDGQLSFRQPSGDLFYVLCQRTQTLFQSHDKDAVEPVKLIRDVPHPSDYRHSAIHELLVTSQGALVRAWLDGRFLGEVRYEALSTGELQVVISKWGDVRKVEIAELDSGPAAPEVEWIDWLGPKLAGGAYNGDGWVRSSEGLTTEKEINGIRLLPPGTKDAAVRVTYILRDSEGLMINARERMEGKVRLAYSALDKVTRLHLDRLKPDGRHAPLQHVILPTDADRKVERTLELRVIGNQLMATLDGTYTGSATDATLSEGEWTLVFMKGVLVKKVEVQHLDAAR